MPSHFLKQSALPWATRLFAWPGLRRLPRLIETTGAALQSKRGLGYAVTWQEIAGALNFITTPAPVIFDVGANVGMWATAFLKACPNTRKLVMFEPQPSCWPRLQQICSDTTSLVKNAASDAPAMVSFWVNSTSVISSLYQKAGALEALLSSGERSQQISVEAITLDDFITDNRIDFVDYVKIDVEGHELSVIKGARRSIQQGTIKAFSFEFGPADIASRTFFADFWEYLASLNLRIYRLGHDGVAIHIPRYSYDLETFGGVANYVASVHPPKRSR